DAAVLAEAAALPEAFARLRDEALRRAESLGVRLPDREGVPSLSTLASLMDQAEAEEAERDRLESLRDAALRSVGRALALRHVAPNGPPVLAGYHAAAAALWSEIADLPAAEVPDAVARLDAGDHPVTALLRL